MVSFTFKEKGRIRKYFIYVAPYHDFLGVFTKLSWYFWTFDHGKRKKCFSRVSGLVYFRGRFSDFRVDFFCSARANREREIHFSFPECPPATLLLTNSWRTAEPGDTLGSRLPTMRNANSRPHIPYRFPEKPEKPWHEKRWALGTKDLNQFDFFDRLFETQILEWKSESNDSLSYILLNYHAYMENGSPIIQVWKSCVSRAFCFTCEGLAS